VTDDTGKVGQCRRLAKERQSWPRSGPPPSTLCAHTQNALGQRACAAPSETPSPRPLAPARPGPSTTPPAEALPTPPPVSVTFLECSRISKGRGSRGGGTAVATDTQAVGKRAWLPPDTRSIVFNRLFCHQEDIGASMAHRTIKIGLRWTGPRIHRRHPSDGNGTLPLLSANCTKCASEISQTGNWVSHWLSSS